jgi:hypothetical protein
MRDSVRRLIGPCLLGLLAAACSTPEHTNTLIFGTNTKIALDVSFNPAGGTPDITLGYKRQEAVWMPLLANQGAPEARQPATCGGNADCTFKSSDNGESGKSDTYSVLASLGAEFSSGAGGGRAEASGGIAQFFATGLAAQKLAEQGGAKLVTVRSPSEAALERAEARAAAAEAQILEITEVRTRAAVQQTFLEQKDRLLNQIRGLDDARAIALATNPPTNNSEMDAFVTSIDPNNQRASDGDVARDVLVKRVEIEAQTPDVLETWEAAVARPD